MKALARSVQIEAVLFVRGFFGFFFTFLFPVIMLFLFGGIYGNQASAFYGGYGAMDMTVPSYIAMVIGVNGLMSFPLTLAEYKENNIYKRFDATPVGKSKIICAQIIVNFVMTVLGILLLIAAGKLVYNIQIAGNIFTIILMLLVSMLAIFSLGFFLAAVARDVKMTNLLCYLVYFVMLFASGSSIPSEIFPEKMNMFSKLLPLTHVVEVMKKSFSGAALEDYWLSVLVLAAITLVLGTLGLVVYRKKTWN